MTYQEYQIAASRTCVKLGSIEKDARHMLLGVFSELGELTDAYKKELAYGKILDNINIEEEWADCAWYLGNEANHNSILFPDKFNEFDYWFSTDENIEIALFNFLDHYTDYNYSNLNNKHFSSNHTITSLFRDWIWFGEKYLQIDTNKALENNIAKLKARYPNSFNQFDALNRNLEKEREKLEK